MDIEMQVICCADCGISFAMTKDRIRRLRESHNTFYCPSGHAQSFVGKTEAERLRERVRELEAEKRRVAEAAEEAKLARRKKSKRTKAK